MNDDWKVFAKAVRQRDPHGIYTQLLSQLVYARANKNAEETKRLESILNYYRTIPAEENTEKIAREFKALINNQITFKEYIQAGQELKQQQIHNSRQENLNF